jgi:hypothetical protein
MIAKPGRRVLRPYKTGQQNAGITSVRDQLE